MIQICRGTFRKSKEIGLCSAEDLATLITEKKKKISDKTTFPMKLLKLKTNID